MLKQFVEQLCEDLGMPPARTTHAGAYELAFEPNLQISLRENESSGMTLLTSLGSLPEENGEEFLQKMLTSNLFGKETGGGFLGLSQDGKKITFTLFLNDQISYKDFHDALEDFVNYAESWADDAKRYKGPR